MPVDRISDIHSSAGRLDAQCARPGVWLTMAFDPLGVDRVRSVASSEEQGRTYP